ncbi:MAG: winged helix-turn-helix domain-containing protein [Hyphomonadaceae bacterium]
MPDQSLSTPLEPPVSIGNVVFDRQARLLSGAGRIIRLEPKQSELLGYLVARPGEPAARGDLIDTIWGIDGSDEALTQAVARLRRSLKELGGNPGVIETLPKTGYRVRSLSEAVTRAEPVTALLSGALSPLVTHAIAFGLGALAMLVAALIWLAIALRPVTIERQVIHDNVSAAAEQN